MPAARNRPSKLSARERLMSLRKMSERIRLKKPKDGFNLPPVPFMQLFRYSNAADKCLMACGLLAALVQGCSIPVLLIVFGRVTDSFVAFALCGNTTLCTSFNATYPSYNTTPSNVSNASSNSINFDIEEIMTTYVYYYVSIAAVVIVCGFIQVHTWILASARQTRRIRQLFFRAVMRQEMEWFDCNRIGSLNSRLNDDVNKIGAAIGDNFSFFVNRLTTLVAGLIVGFVMGWRLTLVILAMGPLVGITSALMGKFLGTWTTKELKAYAKAGDVAANILRNIRTVVAYGAEEVEVERYNEKLGDAEKQGVRKGVLFGLFLGFTWFIIFSTYALGFWYGSTLVLDPDVDFSPGRLLTVFFCVLVSATNAGYASPMMEEFVAARTAAALVYHIIEKKSKIDGLADEGTIPNRLSGEITFANVNFQYPSRRNRQALDHLSVKFKAGETTVLVGPSGAGKSTILKMIQRLYDPDDGKVTLDGEDIRQINVRWLRKQIGIVQQEPVLFATSITENIRFGRDDATIDDVINAAKAANAYDFVMELPEKFDTVVGTGGCQLSGGQKQRIAIARALVRDPKVLLLDQASSALDTHSESIVLGNLCEARQNRTTIIVTHRLSAIRSADVIIGIEHGTATERGTHEDLITQNGVYFALATLQVTEPTEGDGGEDESGDKECNEGTRVDTRAALQSHSEESGVFCLDQLEVGTADIAKSQIDDVRIPIPDDEVNTKYDTAESAPDNEYDTNSSSYGSLDANEEKTKSEEEDIDPAPFARIMCLNSSEYPYIIWGTIGAVVSGCIHPFFAMMLAGIVGVFGQATEEQKREGATYYCSVLAVIAAVVFVSNSLQHSMFAKSGQILTRRIRKMALSSILRQKIEWFDERSNAPGVLTSRLASDAGYIHGAAGVQIGYIVSILATIVGALILAFYFGWKLALVELSFFPFVIAAQAVQARLMLTGSRLDQKYYDDAGLLVMEAMTSLSTIIQLGKEDYFSERYNTILGEIERQGKRLAIVQGVTFGISSSVMFFSSAATFRFGAHLVTTGEMTFDNVFRVFFVIVFVGIAIGRSSKFAPDYTKARKAAARIFQMIDSAPSPNGEPDCNDESMNGFRGELELKGCEFTYPTRPDSLVLRGLNVRIEHGKTLALVGQSGCGKSTCVQLLERFYDTGKGQVLVDGQDISLFNVKQLRSRIGIVFQDPVLFEGTIYDNITYGDARQTEPNMQEVVEVAKLANIHDFIINLEKGYDTQVGRDGGNLSRGQKQRIAIARALIRKPSILLLDEATSALDTENEKIVQNALDRARMGRTTIMIAHRLSTIQNADKIAVMSDGKIIEQGSHSELMESKGAYYKLATANVTLS